MKPKSVVVLCLSVACLAVTPLPALPLPDTLYMFSASQTLPVDNKSVLVLEGMLQTAEFFGSPGFGTDPKHDSVERVYVLQMPDLIRFRNDVPSDSLGDQGSVYSSFWIQLVIMDTLKAAQILGKRCSVEGKAFWQHTGHHRTSALLFVDRIEAIASYANRKD